MSKVRHVQMSAFPDLQPDKPIGPILPSVFRGTNADLMAAVAPFYLTGSVLDVTYGEGAWWSRFQPDPFTAHDLYKLDGVDFTDLPEADNTYDAVCYDPPYVISGGSSATLEFQDRYGIGLENLPSFVPGMKADGLLSLIVSGLAECIRVSRGYVLVKCMEFAQCYRFHDYPHVVTTAALEFGCLKHDVIIHHTGSGPGGHNIFDPVRARRHHSYLLVFTKVAP